jgi:hypothetical protein
MSKRQKRSKITITAILSLIITTATALLGGGCGTTKAFKLDLKIEEDSFERTEGGENPDRKAVNGHYKDKTETCPPPIGV